MSKGSKQRLRQVSNEEYASRWDAIFSRDQDTNETPQESNSEVDDKPDDNSRTNRRDSRSN